MNEWLIQNAWLIPALPLGSFVFMGALFRNRAPRVGSFVSTLFLFAAAALSYALAWRFFHGETAPLGPTLAWDAEWIHFQDGLSVRMGIWLDALSVLMLVVVTTVSALVHLYSIGYMAGDPGYGRYFAYLGLFTFSMLGLVVAPNLFQTYVFWELVGLSSFLLIGFYFEKPSAVAASKKAFIVTRFADLGFLIGILVLGYQGSLLGSASAVPPGGSPLDFAFLTRAETLAGLAASGTLTAALCLVFMGAAGKSAMFPLHIWLPDAMEGPTPVSALIHAATMVVAGVYLVARLFPAYAAAPLALETISYVGLFTSVFAALIACTQNDIKRVLAFSTLSQLGYMMFALGVASAEHPLGYTASLFHLFTHAFFKALLFLGAGAVIHAVHSNDVWRMGGLKRKMPATHVAFAIAVLAIAGIWPLSGFYSKDEILAAALESGHWLHFAGGLAVAGLTAFYMARIYFLAFHGNPRSDGASHAHEAPLSMLFPLVILSLLSIASGWLPFGDHLFFGNPEAHTGTRWEVAIPATLAALVGLFFSAYLYIAGQATRAESIGRALGGFGQAVRNKFYIDEIYLFVTHRIVFRLVAAPAAWFDRQVVDGAVNASAAVTRGFAGLATRLQTGQLQTYGVWLAAGAIVAALYLGLGRS